MRLPRPPRMGSLLTGLSMVFALAALPHSANAAWLPPTQLTHDYALPQLPLNQARCIAAGDSGRLYLVWYDERDGDYDIYFKYFDGCVWTPDVCVSANSSDSQSPSIALDDEGKLHLVWSDMEDGTFDIYYKTYDGVTWGATTKLSNGGTAETPVIAVDGAGNVHVVWREYRSGAWALYYRRFDGSIWSTSEVLTPAGAYPRFPSLSTDAENNVHLVWQDMRISTNSEIYYKQYDGTAWESEERLTTSEGTSELPSVTVDSRGAIHVFWDDARGGTTAIYHKVSAGSTWGADELFASDAHGLHEPSCCAGMNATLYVVWYQDVHGSIFYARFDGNGWLPPEVIGYTDGGGTNPCVASLGDGWVSFVWQSSGGVDGEIMWRFYQEVVPRLTLLSADPDHWFSCESVQVLITGENFAYGARAWLAKDGQTDISGMNATVLSPTTLSCEFDLGPVALGPLDVVVEIFDGQRDTLDAGFLIEQGMWGPDTRLTAPPCSLDLQTGNPGKTAIDSDGVIHLVWADWRDGETEIYYKRGDGETWGPDTRLTNASGGSLTPTIAVDGENRLHVVWSDFRDGNWEIYYKSYDGEAWSADQRLTSAAQNSQHPAVAVDPSDNVYVAWQDCRLNPQSSDIYAKRMSGSTWEPDFLLYNGALNASLPKVATDLGGNVHVAWVEGSTPSQLNYLEYRRFDGLLWGSIDTLAAQTLIWVPSIATGPDGSVHVCWEDLRYFSSGRSYEIYYRRHDGLGWGPDQRLTEAPGESRDASLAVAPDGVVHVVWTDKRWDNPDLYHACFDGVSWTPNGHLTQAPNNSAKPSIVCDAEGNVHLVWFDKKDGSYNIYYKAYIASTLAGVDGDGGAAGQIDAGTPRLIARPNPAPCGAALQFVVRQESQVKLSIYDVSGRLIWTHDAGKKAPGHYEIGWDGRDSRGSAVSPGVYFVRLVGDRDNTLTKVVVVR